MRSSFDAIVIGGGVVGLACAAALSRRRRSVLLLERHARFATENSGRSSGVIHAGLHHPDDWLRTTLCLRGRELLYRRCRLEEVPHAITGKLIVGDAKDEPALAALAKVADDRGIVARLLDRADIAEREPLVRAERALLVEPTGIVRTSALAESLVDECEARNVTLLRGADVVGIDREGDGHRVAIQGASFVSPHLVVAAGLASDRLAAMAGLDVDALGLRQRWVRGTWMALDPRHRKAIGTLVYPLPDIDGLGIHLTRDVDGFLMAGPDAEWADTPEFTLADDPERADRFAAAIARLTSLDVRAEALHPLMVGVRPRLSAPGAPARDFAIHAEGGRIVLGGIESPGLTACLAIAEEVERRLA